MARGKHVYRPARSGAGVFVDGTGRRARWTQRALRVLVIAAAAVIALVLVSVVGGVPLPGLTHPVTLPSNEPAHDRGDPVGLAEGPVRKKQSGSSSSPGEVSGGVDGVVRASHGAGGAPLSSPAGAPPFRSSTLPAAGRPASSHPAGETRGGSPTSPVRTSSPSATATSAPTTSPVTTPSTTPTSRGRAASPTTTPPGRTHTRTVGATPTQGPKSTHPGGGPKSTHPGGGPKSTNPGNGSPTSKPTHTPRPHARRALGAVPQ